MAIELGKFSNLVSRDRKPSLGRIISISADAFFSISKLPYSLAKEEGKKSGTEEADTLVSIAERLQQAGYIEAASYFKALNQAFNESGLLTDEEQKELVAKVKETPKP